MYARHALQMTLRPFRAGIQASARLEESLGELQVEQMGTEMDQLPQAQAPAPPRLRLQRLLRPRRVPKVLVVSLRIPIPRTRIRAGESHLPLPDCLRGLVLTLNRISTHARWVIMLVVLFVGLLLFAFLVWFLHRRYRRKQELGDHSRAPGVQPDMNTWGPGQSVHEFRAPGEGAAVAEQTEKGKERAGASEQATDSKRSSRRLKKPWGNL